MQAGISFDNTFAALPAGFFAHQGPTPVAAPRLLRLNEALADTLGLDPAWLASPDGVAALAGSRVPEGAAPLAAAYAGHQFGHFVPQLGDGRAILLGEVVDRAGRRRDIQLKGSGRTPFSRGGDGRAALGPVLREYLVSEAMAALGIPTTRALAAVATGESVIRETLLPGAVLTRVASSHIRVGTFQYFAARRDTDKLRLLADHVIARHYPEAAGSDEPYRALLAAVVDAQARLVARWLLVGFVHGVMNTDNMSVAGETIDYGPCAFLDAYDPATVFSSIDEAGRYAYANQPGIALWNLSRLAETLLPVMAADPADAVPVAEAVLGGFATAFEAAYLAGLRRKLGLFTPEPDDRGLADALLAAMAASRADFTMVFRRLGEAAADPAAEVAVSALFADPAAFGRWSVLWRARLAREPQDGPTRRDAMQAVNPLFIPRNQRVEQAIAAAVERDDLAPFDALLAACTAPFAANPAWAHLAEPPSPGGTRYRTFCGT